MDIGTLTNEQLIVGAGMIGDGVIGLDDSAWRISGVQVSARVARRGRQDTGRLLDTTARQAGYTHNMAERPRFRIESPSRELRCRCARRPRDGQAEGVGKTADRGEMFVACSVTL